MNVMKNSRLSGGLDAGNYSDSVVSQALLHLTAYHHYVGWRRMLSEMRVAYGAGSRPEFRRRRKGEDSNPGGRCICAYSIVGLGCSSSVHYGRTTCVESVLPNGGDGGCGR